MIAARARGLDTCPQAAWPAYEKAIKPVLGIGENETIVCGMALGYKDPNAIENTLVPDREPVEGFTTFLD
jgi:nitroreductase